MVEFEYHPWEKIIVHEIAEHKVDDLMNMQVQGVTEGGTARPINWSNGILFLHMNMQPTEDVIREQIQGTVHWSGLYYARMPKYVSSVVRAGKITVPIINFSNHIIFKPMAIWLKELK